MRADIFMIHMRVCITLWYRIMRMPQDLNGSHIRLVSYDIKNGEQYVFYNI